MQWESLVLLDRESASPLFAQISQQLSQAIARGVLPPGQRLPGSRALAQRLQVHRSTALAAYQDLEAQGWLRTLPSSGTFVSGTLPDPGPVGRAPVQGRATAPGFSLPELPPAPQHQAPALGQLALQGGVPDLRALPTAEIGRALRRAALHRGGALLGYGPGQGYAPLRQELARLLRERRGLVADPEEILVTRGAQMALALCASVLVQPGQVVAVEQFGYRPAWAAFAAQGAQLAPLEVDEEGVQVEALERLLERGPLRALYLTPHHQYPTTATLRADRRLRLLRLAQRHRFALIEDDYDNEFHYDGAPVLPMASADSQGSVIYIGSFAKILAPALRVGYVVAPRPVIQAMLHKRILWDRQGDNLGEFALTELLQEGWVERHIRRTRRLYQERRDALEEALRRELGDRLQWRTPPGGMSLWVRASGINTDAWAQACQPEVLFRAQSAYHFHQAPGPFVRLGFAAQEPRELALAAGLMASRWPS